jgi:hypothetical protein
VSEMSEGPDWWQASDGKWYPPHTHPDYIAPQPEPELESGPTVPVSLMGAPPSKTPWAIGLVVLLALAVLALVVALVAGSGSGRGSALPSGQSSATINILIPRSGEPSFSGIVAGRALTGTVSTPSSSNTFGGTLVTYRGDLDATAYVLHVALNVSGSPSANLDEKFAFDVSGTYGAEPVTATASFSLPTSTSAPQADLAITGHIGSQAINGVARVSPSNDGSTTVTATFSVAS